MSDDRVTVELTDAGPIRLRTNGRTFEPGDRREFPAEHTDRLADYWRVVDERDEQCGAEMSDGSTCDRPADECPYH